MPSSTGGITQSRMVEVYLVYFIGLDQEMGGEASWSAAAALDIMLPLSAIKVRVDCHRFIDVSAAASETTLVIFPLRAWLHIGSRAAVFLQRSTGSLRGCLDW